MSSNTNTNTAGISTTGLLGIVFIVLKLTNVIDWSWWWVTCPFWGGLALFLTIFLIGAIFIIISTYLEQKRLSKMTPDERIKYKIRKTSPF